MVVWHKFEKLVRLILCARFHDVFQLVPFVVWFSHHAPYAPPLSISVSRNIVAFQLLVVVVRTSTYTQHVPVCCCNLYSIWLLQFSNASKIWYSPFLALSFILSVCIRNKCYINVYFVFALRFSSISCFPFPSMCKCVVKHTPNAICVRQTERDQAHTANEENIYIYINAHTLFTIANEKSSTTATTTTTTITGTRTPPP